MGEGDTLVIQADPTQESRSPEMDVLILGGQPIKESVAWMGPFVMNTKAEVLKAFDDFQKGVLGTIPAADITGVHGTPHEVVEGN
jgi:redox-sensitive bicupin YhaK (pirin superfamily)